MEEERLWQVESFCVEMTIIYLLLELFMSPLYLMRCSDKGGRSKDYTCFICFKMKKWKLTVLENHYKELKTCLKQSLPEWCKCARRTVDLLHLLR